MKRSAVEIVFHLAVIAMSITALVTRNTVGAAMAFGWATGFFICRWIIPLATGGFDE